MVIRRGIFGKFGFQAHLLKAVLLGCSSALFTLPLCAAPASAKGIPVHAHGPTTTSWESDGDKGVGIVRHHHPGIPPSENGNSAHQHYMNTGFGGGKRPVSPFSAFGAWIDQTPYIDPTFPFGKQLEYQQAHIAHGWIGIQPRYRFSGDNWNANAKTRRAKRRIEQAFGLWSQIQAHKSPETNSPLKTGFGFRPALEGEDAEILLKWRNISDDNGGGVAVVNSNPLVIMFDKSYLWDFRVNGKLSDPNKWHFFSVAMHEIGRVAFLGNQKDVDLMTPPVGEPIYKTPGLDQGLPGSYRWDKLVDNPGEDDYFGGWHGSWDDSLQQYVYRRIKDPDSVDAVKSLYSIPVPGPLPLLGAVAAFRCARRLRRLSQSPAILH
jgi:hypothetical protein